jgi:hypothetical protein
VVRSILKLSVGFWTWKKFREIVPEPMPRIRPAPAGFETWLPGVAGI